MEYERFAAGVDHYAPWFERGGDEVRSEFHGYGPSVARPFAAAWRQNRGWDARGRLRPFVLPTYGAVLRA